jgi:hypothetical protein
MVKVFMVRVEMNEDEAIRFHEELEQFERSVRVAFYRGSMTVDELEVKEK